MASVRLCALLVLCLLAGLAVFASPTYLPAQNLQTTAPSDSSHPLLQYPESVLSRISRTGGTPSRAASSLPHWALHRARPAPAGPTHINCYMQQACRWLRRGYGESPEVFRRIA